jgi:hypothetical protein
MLGFLPLVGSDVARLATGPWYTPLVHGETGAADRIDGWAIGK